MKVATAVVLMLVLAVPALAGNNPNVAAHISFDPDGYVFRADPAPYTTGEVFVVLMYVSSDPYGGIGGFTTISLALQVDAGVSAPVSWSSLLPGGLSIGDWASGITLSSTECLSTDPIAIAAGSLFYLGNPGLINIVDHPDYPRWVVDCEDGVDFYCYESAGGVLMDPPDGELCGPVPVETSTWGGIKALYR